MATPTTIRRFNAAAAADDTREWAGGVSLLVEEVPTEAGSRRVEWPGRLLAIGRPDEVDRHEAARNAGVVDLPDTVLLPATVNAHTHLDLTHIGPTAHRPEDGFVAWVDLIRTQRHTEAAGIAASVRRGIALSRSAGVAAIGDIAGAPRGQGNLTPALVMADAGMPGVSFVEFFGIGKWAWRAADWLPQLLADSGVGIGCGDEHDACGIAGRLSRAGVAVGLQPHAPNTVDARVYRWAAELAAGLGLPLCTHVAETPEEREFVAHGAGPQRQMLERLGVWSDDAMACVGRARSPISHVLDALGPVCSPVLVHANDCSGRDVEMLAERRARVVYCPRASAYFHAEQRFGPHRYREMLDTGVTVALGTDSLVNLPASAAESALAGDANGARRGMSVWDEALFLWERDGTEPRSLLKMATTAGAEVLALDPSAFRFTVGSALAGVAAVEVGDAGVAGLAGGVVRSVLDSKRPMWMLWDRMNCGFARIGREVGANLSL